MPHLQSETVGCGQAVLVCRKMSLPSTVLWSEGSMHLLHKRWWASTWCGLFQSWEGGCGFMVIFELHNNFPGILMLQFVLSGKKNAEQWNIWERRLLGCSVWLGRCGWPSWQWPSRVRSIRTVVLCSCFLEKRCHCLSDRQKQWMGNKKPRGIWKQTKLPRDTPEPQILPRKVPHGQPSKCQWQEPLTFYPVTFHTPHWPFCNWTTSDNSLMPCPHLPPLLLYSFPAIASPAASPDPTGPDTAQREGSLHLTSRLSSLSQILSWA